MQLDHLGVAVAKLGDVDATWRGLLGAPVAPPEEVPGQGVRVVFYRAASSEIELLEPTRPDSAVARFLERRGPGLHHLAFRVPSVDRALADVGARGGRLVDTAARPGARGHRVGFAHPAAFGGVLVEFVEGP